MAATPDRIFEKQNRSSGRTSIRLRQYCVPCYSQFNFPNQTPLIKRSQESRLRARRDKLRDWFYKSFFITSRVVYPVVLLDGTPGSV